MNIRRTAHAASAQSQQGATLIVVLALVLTLGLMGLYMFSSSRTQYQMVGNVQFAAQAFNQVEATSAAAEAWLAANRADPGFENYSATTPHLYPRGELAARGRVPKTMVWSDANSLAQGDGRYLVEQMAAGVELPGSSTCAPGSCQQASTCTSVNLYEIQAQSNAVKGTTRMVNATYATEACNN